MTRAGRRAAILASGLLLLAAFCLAGLRLWLESEIDRPYRAFAGEHVDVVLEPGLSATAMLERLGAAGVIARPGRVGVWLRLRGGAGALHAGEYRFEGAVSPREVIARLESGEVLLHPVTIPEGLTIDEVAARFAEAGFGPADALERLFRDPAPIADLDPRADDLEGYLFPDTYRFARGTPPERIVATLVGAFREAIGPDYAASAERLGIDLRQAVTLASMVERETSVPDERPRIARVFHNRLARGMKMQCDPTVLYALRRAGRPVERLTYRDLAFESPWNTYVASGLPPGPIASPGLASLRAAVEPAAGRELFFVAAPGGGHRFSETLDAHLDAVAAWRAHASRSSR